MSPILSAVYRCFDVGSNARALTGRVCPTSVPIWRKGAPDASSKDDRDLESHENQSLAEFRTKHHILTVLSDEPLTRIPREGTTKRLLTKSPWAEVIESSILVYMTLSQ